MYVVSAIMYALLLSPTVSDGMPAVGDTLESVRAKSREAHDLATMCGIISLAKVIREYGGMVSVSELAAEFQGRTPDGVRIGEIVEVAQRFGMTADAVRYEDRALAELRRNTILVVDSNHCLVFEEWKPEHRAVVLWDPTAVKSYVAPEAVLLDKWNGEAIVTVPIRFRRRWLDVMLLTTSVAMALTIGQTLGVWRRSLMPSL